MPTHVLSGSIAWPEKPFTVLRTMPLLSPFKNLDREVYTLEFLRQFKTGTAFANKGDQGVLMIRHFC